MNIMFNFLFCDLELLFCLRSQYADFEDQQVTIRLLYSDHVLKHHFSPSNPDYHAQFPLPYLIIVIFKRTDLHPRTTMFP
jgi:hypothetical protein